MAELGGEVDWVSHRQRPPIREVICAPRGIRAALDSHSCIRGGWGAALCCPQREEREDGATRGESKYTKGGAFIGVGVTELV